MAWLVFLYLPPKNVGFGVHNMVYIRRIRTWHLLFLLVSFNPVRKFLPLKNDRTCQVLCMFLIVQQSFCSEQPLFLCVSRNEHIRLYRMSPFNTLRIVPSYPSWSVPITLMDIPELKSIRFWTRSTNCDDLIWFELYEWFFPFARGGAFPLIASLLL